ncbi:CHAT domain-containing protein [Collybia nuda]|uniref:CHAT domain-containing protein n=1 Tax=Collybia nuda TaxID=64659 RepID=A0A9P5YCE1_9AGAR|nr:CHAT domain-containing protein [Collybia nuda]
MSIAHFKSALGALRLPHTNKIICLEGLSKSYLTLYDKLGDLVLLNSSLEYAETLANGTAIGNSALGGYLHTLVLLHWKLYTRLKIPVDLKAAYRLITAVIDITTLDNPWLSIYQKTLTLIYNEYYYEWNDPDVFEIIIKYERIAVQNTPLGHPDLAMCMGDMGASYIIRYHKSGSFQDLQASLKFSRAAVDITAPGDNLARFQFNLGVSYHGCYELLGSIQDLDFAIILKLSSVNLVSTKSPDLPRYQLGLATSFSERYKKLNNLEDLNHTIQYYKMSVENYGAFIETLPEGHLKVSQGYQLLAKAFTTRFKRLYRENDLDAALNYHQCAVHILPLGHPSLSLCLITLSGSHQRHFERYGKLGDLEIAHKFNIAALECGDASLLENDPDTLNHMAITHTSLYNRLGNVNDLIDALRYLKLAMERTPPGHPGLPLAEQNLALGYTAYYRRFGNVDDLYNAIKYSKKAADSVPQGAEDFAFHQVCLEVQYSDLYDRTHCLNDLEIALKCSKAAVEATPPGHHKYSAHQLHLAQAYTQRYRKLGNHADLISAHECKKEAVKYHELSSPYLPGHQESLAMSYLEHYRAFKNPNDLDEALIYGMSAYHSTSEGHFDIPRHQHSLATTFLERFRNFKDPSELYCALHYSRLSTQSLSTSPNVLWKSATSWAKMAFQYKQPECVKAYKAALQVLPQLIWLGSSLATRHDVLNNHNISDTVSNAVAAAIQFHQPETGVEFIEQGLSITHKQSLQLKDEVTSLVEQYPIDAAALKQISYQLGYTMALPSPDDALPHGSPVDHHMLAAQRTQLIQKIRTYAGFEDFFLPTSCANLLNVASEGPVILLNCSSLGQSDALILLPLPLGIKHVRLPEAHFKAVQLHITKLRTALRVCKIPGRDVDRYGQPKPGGISDSQALFQMVLQWLWVSVVQPIFDALHENKILEGRIWWCPAGLFTYLPIHAASPLQSSFIQSYTFTLDALIQARTRVNRQECDLRAKTIGVIGVSQIPDKSHLSLPAVKNEVDLVMTAFAGHGPKLQEVVDSRATIKNVLEQIEKSSWLHIACHGHQNISNPLQSGILLADGTLELQQILNANLPNAQFVFLSACETAMGDPKLANEAMHLTGGFIAAGFQGAIGTLWRIADSDGPKVATTVYKKALEREGVPNMRLVAKGLHLAIRKLRKEGAPCEQWMPFIHVGI